MERENCSVKPQILYYQSTTSPVIRELTSIRVVSQPKSSAPQITKLTPTSLQAEHSLRPTRGVNIGDITKPAPPLSFHLDTDVESENEVFFPQHVLQNLHQGPLVHLVDELQIAKQDEEVIEEDNSKMAEERYVAPVQFAVVVCTVQKCYSNSKAAVK